MNFSSSLVRARVPFGWALGVAALFLARPTMTSYLVGLVIAALGEVWRAWASGHLIKWKGLTRGGPYAWTRNPLYFGSLLIGVGFSVASARWEVGLLFVGFVVGVYLPVIRAEAARLARQYPEDYPDYARRVPLLLPRSPRGRRPLGEEAFDWRRFLENREHVTLLGWLAGALLLGLRMR